MQEAQSPCDSSAVAGPFGSPLPLFAAVPTAVADPPIDTSSFAVELVQIGFALVVEQAPAEQLVHIEGLGEELVFHTDMVAAPECPDEATLQSMKPLGPRSPIERVHLDSHGVANGTAAAKSAVAANHKTQADLLALARAIRRPRVYVGFILMGLLKKCQPCVWEGRKLINLIELFARGRQKCASRPPLWKQSQSQFIPNL